MKFSAVMLNLICLTVLSFCIAGTATAEDEPKPSPELPKTAVALNKAGTVHIDKPGNRLLLKTQVVLCEGTLEMLLCRKGTKEHESILSLDAASANVHAGLLALGVESGKPVSYQPTFQPPRGTEIDIFANWIDNDGKEQRVDAREWIRSSTHRYFEAPLPEIPADLKLAEDSKLRYDDFHKVLFWHGIMSQEQKEKLSKLSTDKTFQQAIKSLHEQSQPKEMTATFVFAGSGFLVDTETGQQRYMAENGNVICVANFPSAMIDVAENSSSQGTSNLTYEVHPDRVPDLRTVVILELIPKLPGNSNEAYENSDISKEGN
ncbi:YdjY domain-containing protein [Calycomorphotria hydatis]|uniref:SLA1 homology domain-containing protein n=1 Tax=Calycomorphotria hydatis TaxID=2528027 RepID=A0A517T5Z1_9PLAN|nr:YdjY domain-containing protein [Calycomorphotria hydatis]QDT63783.1 hypothetical protein V22_10080 [Calycomorphotria hydatis]